MISDDIDPVSFASDSEHSRSYDMGYNAGQADAIAARDAAWVKCIYAVIDGISSPEYDKDCDLEWQAEKTDFAVVQLWQLKARMTGDK